MKYESVGPALARSVVTWADLKWIRELWGGPIVVKGVLTGDDARRAVDEGASAVIVSNHGGRQLDGVAAGLRALPEVVAAAGDRIEVHGRRHPLRQRHREGEMPGREGGPHRTRVCTASQRLGDRAACAIEILRADLVRRSRC
jgi:hypothetical protein